MKYEIVFSLDIWVANRNFFGVIFLAPRFRLKSIVVFGTQVWLLMDKMHQFYCYFYIFLFCCQKNKNSSENASMFNQIDITSLQLQRSQQEIEIDFMMSFFCFWYFIWLSIVADNIFFIMTNILRQNFFEIKVHTSNASTIKCDRWWWPNDERCHYIEKQSHNDQA